MPNTTVTITVDGPCGHESVTITRETDLVLSPLFAAVHAVIDAHAEEVVYVTSAMKVLGEALSAAGLMPEEKVHA